MMELLLNHNANVHARDAQGRTAMHFAAAVGHAHLITVSVTIITHCTHVISLQLLVKRGADINAVNAKRESSLHYAAFHRRRECVSLLLSLKADASLKTLSNNTALDFAKSKGFQDIIDVFQQFQHQ